MLLRHIRSKTAPRIRDLGISPGLRQQTDNIRAPLLSRPVQRRLTGLVPRIDIGTRRQQQARQLKVAVTASGRQRLVVGRRFKLRKPSPSNSSVIRIRQVSSEVLRLHGFEACLFLPKKQNRRLKPHCKGVSPLFYQDQMAARADKNPVCHIRPISTNTQAERKRRNIPT